MTDEAQEGGRIFFSSAGRSLVEEDEIRLISVGVDIGSSTTHLVFSRLVLERLDARYVVSQRELLHRSRILLTPYLGDTTIDAAAIGRFLDAEFAAAGLSPDEIDTGALVLTGVAVRRVNARAVGELFSHKAGKMVAVSAGDSLETVMAAYGSGAVLRSLRESATVVNIDIGGGTSKIAVCRGGEVVDRTAIDVGARVIVTDEARRLVRVEPAGHWFARDVGLELRTGETLSDEMADELAGRMAERLLQCLGPARGELAPILRLPPLQWAGAPDVLTISGGVSEYVYGTETRGFGDLGPALAREVRRQAEDAGLRLTAPYEGIRATVIGASQYTTQVSGGTIFVDPLETLPMRNVPVIAPTLPLEGEAVDADAVRIAIRRTLDQQELTAEEEPVALFVPWRGSASFTRLDGFCRGVLAGLAPVLSRSRPLILAGDGDVGGILGMHLKTELGYTGPIVSIDGLDLKAFDFIDIGAVLRDSGAAPVVIKSLVFPADADLGRPRSGVTELVRANSI